jgi:hypothetical protein
MLISQCGHASEELAYLVLRGTPNASTVKIQIQLTQVQDKVLTGMACVPSDKFNRQSIRIGVATEAQTLGVVAIIGKD